MNGNSPPGRAEASGSNAGDRRSERDTEQIPDQALVGNRKLIKRERGFELFEVMERRRRFHYEIVSGDRRWSFPLLWSAYLKLDRLVAKAGDAQ